MLSVALHTDETKAVVQQKSEKDLQSRFWADITEKV